MTKQMSNGGPQSPTPLAVPWTPPAQQQMQAQLQPQPAMAPPAAPQAYHAPHMQASQTFQNQPQHAYPVPPQPPAGYAHPPQQQPVPPNMPARNFPPMPMDNSAAPEPEAASKSKSLFANLLKRKPKEEAASSASKSNGSLFDKNFVFGLVAGIMLGFVVLPMVFGGGAEPAESYTPTAELAAPQSAETAMVEDGSFVDAVLAEETP